jgi:hypothetical protein
MSYRLHRFLCSLSPHLMFMPFPTPVFPLFVFHSCPLVLFSQTSILFLPGNNQQLTAGVPVDVNNQLQALTTRMTNAETLTSGTTLTNTVISLRDLTGSSALVSAMSLLSYTGTWQNTDSTT